MRRLKIGSLFAGIGGFELGIERAIPNAETIWQVEQNKYCQSILQKHWPNAKIYDDVRNITKHNVEPVDILIGGFPCQSISVAGKQEGLENAEKSGLWWEFHRIISELRPRIVVMENVPNVLRLGGLDILGSLAEIGYDAEWTIISAKQFGAPHLRKRWFCVAYPNVEQLVTLQSRKRTKRSEKITSPRTLDTMDENRRNGNVTNPHGTRRKKQSIYTQSTYGKTRKLFKHDYRKNVHVTDSKCQRMFKQSNKSKPMETKIESTSRSGQNNRTYERNYWKTFAPKSPLCTVDDGIPARVARLKALGNAIVPQCSQYIGECIVRSGLLDDI